jgi:hypothetical protein
MPNRLLTQTVFKVAQLVGICDDVKRLNRAAANSKRHNSNGPAIFETHDAGEIIDYRVPPDFRHRSKFLDCTD